MYHLFCRVYQLCFRLVSYVLPWRKPELLVGEHSLDRLPELIKSKGIDRVLIVTDQKGSPQNCSEPTIRTARSNLIKCLALIIRSGAGTGRAFPPRSVCSG